VAKCAGCDRQGPAVAAFPATGLLVVATLLVMLLLHARARVLVTLTKQVRGKERMPGDGHCSGCDTS
jgi:hypothetical protein